MKSKRLWIFLALSLLGACGHAGTETPSSPAEASPVGVVSPAVLAPGDYKKTLTVGSELRSYILHVPARYDGSTALPLVFVLHGYGGNAAGMIKQTGMNEKADQENFFVAYLQGTYSDDGKAGWNSGLSKGNEGFTADDVGFVRQLAQVLTGHLNLDRRRLYAAGFSNGGFMTHRLGVELPDLLAGIAVVAGTVGISADDGATFSMIPSPQAPMPVAIVHGKQDANIAYEGGMGENATLYVKPVSAAVQFWTAANACAGAPEKGSNAAGNVVIADFTGCAQGSEVELFTVLDGGHEWPRLETHTHFSATDAIWDFFSRHSQGRKISGDGLPQGLEAQTLKDLAYATLSPAQKLDLYVPAGPGPFPVLVYIHGGGWRSGDKISPFQQGIVAKLLGQGYAVASLNYRLSGEAVFPAAVQDVKAAVRWLRAHAQEYRLDPERLGAWGDSAGGHLASILGTSCGVAELEGAELGHAGRSSCVQAVVDWYGPTDFLVGDQQYIDAGSSCPAIHDLPTSGESEFMGFPIQEHPEKVKRADPITYVTSDDPPFFIQHGTADCVVPPQQSQIFYEALAPAIGAQNVSLTFFGGWKHGDPRFRSETNVEAVIHFLNQRLK